MSVFNDRSADECDLARNPEVRLSERQIRLIRTGWTRVFQKGSTDIGKWIVRTLFTRHPDLKVTFGLDGVDDDQQLLNHPAYLRHSAVFTDLLEMVVESLDALEDVLGPLLVSYGHRHVDFEIHQGFRPEYWEYFGEVMTDFQDSWPIRKSREDTRLAWVQLVFFLVNKVRQGYQEGKDQCQPQLKRLGHC